MAERTLLERVKTRLEDTTVSDDLLNDFIDDATDEVLARTNQEELNSSLERVIVGCVVLYVNRIGTEGTASESYSGVSTSYLDSLPANLQAIINHNTRLGRWE